MIAIASERTQSQRGHWWFLFGLIYALAAMAFVMNSTSVGAGQTQSGGRPFPQLTPKVAATITATPTCASGWNLVDSPNVGPGNSEILEVAVISSNDVWAVGSYGISATGDTLTIHWDGQAWSVVPSPTTDASYDVLYGISAVSSNDVWAVGYSYDSGSGGHSRSLILHWNGVQWQIVPSPSPFAISNNLYDVEAISANDVWAVGDAFPGLNGFRSLIMHWDGSAWTVVPSPNPGARGNGFYGVSGTAANEVWAVGSFFHQVGATEALVARWDGNQWSVVPVPSPGGYSNLEAVAARTPNDVWAVGWTWANDTALIVHWDGTSWQIVPHTLPSGSYVRLDDVTALGPNNVWAVGSGQSTSLVAHWDGHAWTPVSVPLPGGNGSRALRGVAAAGPSDIWAVGVGYMDDQWIRTMTLHYGGLQADYGVSVSANATIVPASNYVPGSTCSSCTVQVNLPFAYSFYDTSYSQVTVSNKGVVQFASSSASGADTCLPNASFNYAIFAYWDDHNTNINDNMGIFTSTIGTAPNRIFNIEWRSGYVANDVRSNFAVRLYEGQPKFDVIYASTRRGFSATVGVQKGTGERFTQYECSTNGSIPDGTMLSFDQRVCAGTGRFQSRKP